MTRSAFPPWPAGLGGQYLVWDDDARAFLFSESKRSVNAFMGSPAVTQASAQLVYQDGSVSRVRIFRR